MSVGIVDKQTGDRIPTAGMPAIDNALDLTSSNPVQNAVITAALADKQDKSDNNLQTTDKTVVGAINEHEGDIGSLRSGFTNLDNEVNGDATEYPYANVITIEDAVPANLAECNVKIEPVQDLHGFDHPWVGGAGKNKLPLVLLDIKTANTTGTWSGNAYTDNGVTFTINTDSDGNVVSITEDGTSSGAAARLFIPIPESQISLNTSYVLTGTPSGGSANTYRSYISNQSGEIFWDYGKGVTFSFTSYGESTGIVVAVSLADSATVSNITFYPMIRLATETDATFAPYTNICPITGHTEASVEVTDGDETTKTCTIALGDTIYGGTVDFDSGVMTVDRALIEYDGSNDETWYDNKIEDGYSTPRPAGLIDSICDKFKNAGGRTSIQGEYWAGGSNLNFVCSEIITSLTDWKTYLANNPLQICYQFSTPTTIQLTPQQIQLLKGTNTLTASTGDISVTVNGVSGAIGQVQEQVNGLAEDVAELAKQLPDAPTTDGAYVLTVTVADGTPTYSWESAT